jgi:predicted nucleic acid-binding protein
MINDSVVITTQLLIVEMASALNRRVREGTVSLYDYQRLFGRFCDDCRTAYQIITVNEELIENACELLERQALRAYDAVHLATALTVNHWLIQANEAPAFFISADNDLNAAAAAEGLHVDNPLDHG